MMDAIVDYPYRVVEESPRPQSRPALEISYRDADKIERVVWAEASGEGVEGRNAVRGVIFNRLASSRFPDTVDEIFTADEFEPIRKYGSAENIPIPKEDLENGHVEFADYYQLGKDAVDGRTFFQNGKTTQRRGTEFSGPDPLVIGKHTFTRGYENQEPVLDTAFSHNIKIAYDNFQEDYALSTYSLGGIPIATKGITTKEGKEMASKKFHRDDKKADTNKDGMLSAREKEIGDAVQKNEIVEMYYGGMAKKLNMNHGGMAGGIMGYDDVSGNPIPLGSSAENVRDDIDAKLSTDEYVIPAHVVKWHGLKQIQMMQAEAEMGLMSMKMDGLIQQVDESVAEEPEEEEIEESDEDIDVEVAAFEVDDKLDDSDEIEKILPRTSAMPIMQKKKYAFAV